MATRITFNEGKSIEKTLKDRPDILNLLFRNHVSNYGKFVQASKEEDRQGIDFWVYKTTGQRIAVDIKSMNGIFKDQVPLESWSVTPENGKAGIVGWTRDLSKRTDVVLWYWNKSGDYLLLPYKQLRDWFIENWQDLRTDANTRQQETPPKNGKSGWHSECIFTDIDKILNELKENDQPLSFERYTGNVKGYYELPEKLNKAANGIEWIQQDSFSSFKTLDNICIPYKSVYVNIGGIDKWIDSKSNLAKILSKLFCPELLPYLEKQDELDDDTFNKMAVTLHNRVYNSFLERYGWGGVDMGGDEIDEVSNDIFVLTP